MVYMPEMTVDVPSIKHAINSILYGTADEMLPVLESYCRCEQLNNGVTRKRIGF